MWPLHCAGNSQFNPECISGYTPASGRMESSGICSKAMWCVAVASSPEALSFFSDPIGASDRHSITQRQDVGACGAARLVSV